MAKIRVAITIDASPDAVWDAVGRIERHVDWMVDAASITFTSHRHEGVGTTFDCDTHLGPFHVTDRMEVTQWKPGKAMGVRHRGLVRGTGRFTLKKVRRGATRFTWEERLSFPLWMGGPVGARAAKPVLRLVWRRNLRALKRQVEGRGQPV